MTAASDLPLETFRQILIWPLVLVPAESGGEDESVRDVVDRVANQIGAPWAKMPDGLRHLDDGGSGISSEAYAEFVYFHSFVRRVLHETNRDGESKPALRIFRRDDIRFLEVDMATAASGGDHILRLKLGVERIRLYLFDLGVAILVPVKRTSGPLRFFLGGHDLEMTAIAELVAGALGPAAVFDKDLRWGAREADYAEEIRAALAEGARPVTVELVPDPDLPTCRIVQIDHHGCRAGEPSALAQAFALLDLPPSAWTRRMDLIAANDVGHIDGMLAAGATLDEARAIRAEDRAAQGVTERQETEALAAAADSAVLGAAAVGGRPLRILRLPHAAMSPALDALRFQEIAAGQAPTDVLAIAPREVGFFGAGGRIRGLDAVFPGGWCGGALPERGFWGRNFPNPPETELIAACAAALTEG